MSLHMEAFVNDRGSLIHRPFVLEKKWNSTLFKVRNKTTTPKQLFCNSLAQLNSKKAQHRCLDCILWEDFSQREI